MLLIAEVQLIETSTYISLREVALLINSHHMKLCRGQPEFRIPQGIRVFSAASVNELKPFSATLHVTALG